MYIAGRDGLAQNRIAGAGAVIPAGGHQRVSWEAVHISTGRSAHLRRAGQWTCGQVTGSAALVAQASTRSELLFSQRDVEDAAGNAPYLRASGAADARRRDIYLLCTLPEAAGQAAYRSGKADCVLAARKTKTAP